MSVQENDASGDQRSLVAKLRAAERRRKLSAFMLVAPLLGFVLVMFVGPIISLLYFSVDDPKLSKVFPLTATAMTKWDGTELPDEAVYAALAIDLKKAYKAKTAAALAM